ncbi:DNA damage-binding protein 2 [Cocos nucifera]|uniref:DNA damage-binding protein 2 n=1 Tax=Cocos nucifera TaxID=13894 RepID=A0A8K0MZK1_COCNU|nr:DNA damage-binding protein 2 [Cocos nucifera]
MPLLKRGKASLSSSSLSRVLVHMETDSEESPFSSSSSSEGEEEEDGRVSDDEDEGNDEEAVEGEEEDRAKKRKAPITISLKKVCKVCKGTGHEAGFKGATYIDCPRKPCFLCKRPGHTTMSCPHRVATEHGVIPAARRNTDTSLDYIFKRQLKAKIPMIKPTFVIPDQLDCGIIRFHSRRVTCLEFHPTRNNVLLSGDKKGQLGIWDYGKLHEKTVYGSIHSCIVNNMKFNLENDGLLYTSSSDGTVRCTDLETGTSFFLLDLNPEGWNGPATWRMLYGMDINVEKGLLLVADNFGYLYLVDGRLKTRIAGPIVIHKKGSKVVGLHCNPVQPDIFLSCGNDHFARIWDARRLEAESSLASLAHGRVVNSAYFSPLTGNKILTTSQDNRIRVWDSIFGNLESPSREIVHSHDFNRHLTPFRAEWDPKDPSESLAVIGRYISENYDGVALHPIDFIDMSTGKLVAEVMNTDITTISPVTKLHPRDDVLASGSSRSLFIWKRRGGQCPEQRLLEAKSKKIVGRVEKKSSGKLNGESDDDFNHSSKEKKLKAKNLDGKYLSGQTKAKP